MNSIYTTHNAEDYDSWKSKRNKGRKLRNEEGKKRKIEVRGTAAQEKKLTLADKMKTALLTKIHLISAEVCTFIEEVTGT